MDALIIAAGFGSRLRDVSDSKPLTPIAGIPLLELGARQAKAAGVKRVVVVTGHEAERIEAALPARVGDLTMVATSWVGGTGEDQLSRSIAAAGRRIHRKP